MIIVGSDLLCYLVALTGSQLATIVIFMPVFGDVTHHLMICGRDDFQVV